MVNPNHHYGPNIDGYEYSHWGTYHRADLFGIGLIGVLKPEQALPGNILEKMRKCITVLILALKNYCSFSLRPI